MKCSRVARRAATLMIGLLVVAAGCSDDGGAGDAESTATTTSTRPLASRAAGFEIAFLSEERTREKQASTTFLASAAGKGDAAVLTQTDKIDEALVWSPDGSTLAFASDRSGSFDIWTVGADGQHLTNLTPDSPAAEGAPAYSPDGSTIAFFSDRGGDGFDIWLMEADGTNPTELFDAPADAGTPAWSPDGSQIAVSVAGDDTSSDIWVADVTTGEARNVTAGTGSNDGPQWAPDGAHIAFSGRHEGDESAEIYTMRPDGTDVRRLTKAKGPDRDPVWSPDGKRIAFISTRLAVPGLEVINEEIFVMRVDGSHQRDLTNSPEAIDRFPRWSPDGSLLAFSGTFNNNTEIIVMNADGSGITNVSRSYASDSWPAWRPEG